MPGEFAGLVSSVCQTWARGDQVGVYMVDDPTAAALIPPRAREGEPSAWDDIVERYAPLVWSVCRRHRLNDADTADVGQDVWLRLVEHVAVHPRPRPALPGWLATTTRRLCLGVLKSSNHRAALVEAVTADPRTERFAAGPDDLVLRAERNQIIRDAIAQLPPQLPTTAVPAHPDTRGCRMPTSPLGWTRPVGGLGPRRAPLPTGPPPLPATRGTDRRRDRFSGRRRGA